MAEWPSSGYAEWALFPSAVSRRRSEPFDPVGVPVRGARAAAVLLFVRDEEEPQFPDAGGAQPLGGRDLGGDDPLGIAGAAAVQELGILARRKVRRHGVEMAREHDAGGRAGGGEDVRPARRRFLALDLPAARGEEGGEKVGDRGLVRVRGGDVHERPGEGDDVRWPGNGHPRWSGTLPASISRMPPSELNTPVASYGM